MIRLENIRPDSVVRGIESEPVTIVTTEMYAMWSSRSSTGTKTVPCTKECCTGIRECRFPARKLLLFRGVLTRTGNFCVWPPRPGEFPTPGSLTPILLSILRTSTLCRTRFPQSIRKCCPAFPCATSWPTIRVQARPS